MNNLEKVKYFELVDFIEKIKLDNDVLRHKDDTAFEFEKYMARISKIDHSEVIHYWLIQMANELVNSNKIEKHYIKKEDMLKKDLSFKTFEINHDRIHDIHNFVVQNDNIKTYDYRHEPVRVSAIRKDGHEEIFWRGAEPEDVQKFMNAFIDGYKLDDIDILNSDPFLKSALIQLLFMRIHPYKDGNGRTARMLHNIKFTEAINDIYEKDYRLCPLNISESIFLNKLTYVNILDNLYFDLEHDNTDVINKWFNFFLNMIDEQLYYSNNRIDKLDEAYNVFVSDNKLFDMMLKRVLSEMDNLDDITTNRLNSDKVKQLLR